MHAAMSPPWVAYKQAATSMLVPVYQHPALGIFWQLCGTYSAGLAAGAGTGTGGAVKYAIADPASGPGAGDAFYTTAISAAFTAGITVLGYVDTNYTAVPLATAQAQVSGAGSWPVIYPGPPAVTSIFFDRADDTAGNASYYQTLCNQVHTVGGAVAVLNWGTVPASDPGYMTFADIVIIHENDYGAGAWAAFLAALPSWVQNYPASRFAALVYNCPSPYIMQQVLVQAQAANIGNIYVTDQDARAGNPWGYQAAYLPAEAAALAAR